MLADVQAHFGLAKPFQRVGNFETEHQRAQALNGDCLLGSDLELALSLARDVAGVAS
jgi:hypothetical protein